MSNNSVKLMGMQLDVGQSSGHQQCPKCNGGKSNEASFVISRVDEGLVFNCHRNSCTYKGFVPSRGEAGEADGIPARSAPVKKARPFSAPTRLLHRGEQEFFRVKYGLNDYMTSDFRWATTHSRMLVPFYDRTGRKIGCTLRGYNELHPFEGVKAIIYYNTIDTPLIDFCTPRELCTNSAVYIIVEDGISARKIVQAGFPAVALNGTHLSVSATRELLDHGVKRVLVWLDSDANSTGWEMVRRNHLLFESIQAHPSVPGTPDPKEHSVEEIRDIIGTYYDN